MNCNIIIDEELEDVKDYCINKEIPYYLNNNVDKWFIMNKSNSEPCRKIFKSYDSAINTARAWIKYNYNRTTIYI